MNLKSIEGDLIDEIHANWLSDYHLLESHHGFVLLKVFHNFTHNVTVIFSGYFLFLKEAV